ncbi:MAG: hypothetical protein COB37_06815 [Kordiimonadales bacterium]|nr:MAG: hypothetical protein COB37_06815 [Kordiimonadales bacterium]
MILTTALLITLTATAGPALHSDAKTTHGEPAQCTVKGYECSTSKTGIVIGKTGDLANLAAVMDDAAERYRKYYGTEPAQAALVLGGSIDAGLKADLDSSGFKTQLPWLTSEDKAKLYSSAIRTQIKAQKPDLSAAALEALVKTTMATLNKTGGNNSAVQREQGAVAHEFAHLWYMDAFWPKKDHEASHNSPQYGGAGPDWLDEMAAVLAENETLTSSRRSRLVTVLKDNPAEALWPLKEYFTMEHPIFRKIQKQMEAVQKEASDGVTMKTRVVVYNDEEYKKLIGGTGERDPSLFYAQSRAFADFLIEATGEDRIFASISRHIADGGTMRSWLRDVGKEKGLPTTLVDLQTRWDLWLQTRTGSVA